MQCAQQQACMPATPDQLMTSTNKSHQQLAKQQPLHQTAHTLLRCAAMGSPPSSQATVSSHQTEMMPGAQDADSSQAAAAAAIMQQGASITAPSHRQGRPHPTALPCSCCTGTMGIGCLPAALSQAWFWWLTNCKVCTVFCTLWYCLTGTHDSCCADQL